MPVYEYKCENCGKRFDIVATLAEKEAGLNPTCPDCGGTKVHQIFGRFTVIGGSKTESDFEDFGPGDEDFGAEGLDEFEDEGLSEEEDLGETGEDLDID
ncbi:MAG: zinc ribbon domain-containing protein [candidate division WOR-3 bacterium]